MENVAKKGKIDYKNCNILPLSIVLFIETTREGG
jgi:hypothetical protein